jgi:hypothetical protein
MTNWVKCILHEYGPQAVVEEGLKMATLNGSERYL